MELTEETKITKEVIQAILKAKKIVRMYLPNNPVYVKTLEETYSKINSYFLYKDELTLKIRQNDIYFESEQVYYNPEKDDNLALFFFKDGLRELTFIKGLNYDEMEEFLKIISLDFERDVLEDDIVTLFWEKDFQNIKYIVDESILTEEEDYEPKAIKEATEDTNTPDNLMKAYKDAFDEAEEVKDTSVIPLSDKDLQFLLQELEKDTLDKTEKFINMLFEMFYMSETRQDLDELTVFFVNSIEYAIKNGNIQTVTQMFNRFDEILNNPNVHQEIKKIADKMKHFAGSETVVTMLGDIIDSGQEIDEKILEDYIKHLDKNAITSFMKILGELQTIHARKIAIDALTFLGAKDISMLAKGLHDSRWYVVRNIIYILRKIGDRGAVEYLLKTVKHGDIRVKKEVIRTLGELGGSNVLITLRDCLDDPDLQVRTTAVRALGNIGSEACKRIIMDRISNKEFRDKDFEEKKEFFDVFSRWKDTESFNFLVSLLKHKTFFGKSKNDEIRACAAYCLGLTGNKDALPILNKFKTESNKLLREFVFTAIKRIEHGQQG